MAERDFIIRSLQGGLNNSDPSNSIPDDQVTVAENVEWVQSMLGERRLGSDNISITGSDLVSRDAVSFLYRYLPTSDESQSELWAVGVVGQTVGVLVRKTTTWLGVTLTDAIETSDPYLYQIRAATLHGKLFLAYKAANDRNRLHVWDGSVVRRTGLTEPNMPAVSNAGTGSYAGTRSYRVRYTVQVAGVTILRSEPSEANPITPSGTHGGVQVDKPASIGEGETHWEVEASTGDGNYWTIVTVPVATLSVIDTTPFNEYATDPDYFLSADIGDYATIPAARFIAVDDDRLIWAGSFEEDEFSSRVGWTPVNQADGVGNDERIETDTDPFIDLDGLEGGPITDMISGIQGYIYVFKSSHIYQLVRTGQRTRAYQAYNITKKHGAIEGSVVTGLDEFGNPILFFLDPSVGPCMLGRSQVRSCGADIRATWQTVNLDGAKVVARGLYVPKKRQVLWWVATEDSETPNLILVLQTNRLRAAEDGHRRGWSLWTGAASEALCACLYADNIDENGPRSLNLVPFIGVTGNGLIWRMETGDTDNGTAYDAHIATKPYTPVGLLHQFEVKSSSILTKAVSGASLDVGLIRDFGLETKTVTDVSCTPTGSESQIITPLSDLAFSELRVVQAEFADADGSSGQWQINEFALRQTTGQRST
jgi:hypothetical protein